MRSFNHFNSGIVLVLLVLFIVSGSLPFSLPAYAMGKKPAAGPTAGNAFATPNPDRPVTVNALKGIQPFTLPNGSGQKIDISVDLHTMVGSALSLYTHLQPSEPAGGATAALGASSNNPCETHLEVHSAITTLQLNAFEFGVTFGYSPTGDNAPVTSITGKANVKIGTIAMDFSVFQCTAGVCTQLATSTADALTSGVDLNLSIDFGTVKTGADLVSNTQFGNILRGIMADGMKKLARSADMSKLAWKATVRESNLASGTMVFDQGAQQGIGSNQTFVIYANLPANGACNASHAVAHVHSTQVETVSTTAVVDDSLDSRGILPGDIVMLRLAPPALPAASFASTSLPGRARN
jgi:hypothetical protein